MNPIYYILFFCVYFFIHYLEGITTGGTFSVAQVWKIPFLLLMVLMVIKTRRSLFNFEKIGYLYAVEPFLCPALFSNPLSIIVFSSKQLPLLLCFNFWLRFRDGTLERILLTLAQYICLTSLITLLGIIEPIQEYVSADSHYDGMVHYSSMFGKPHAASSYFCGAFLVLLYFFINKKFKIFIFLDLYFNFTNHINS